MNLKIEKIFFLKKQLKTIKVENEKKIVIYLNFYSILTISYPEKLKFTNSISPVKIEISKIKTNTLNNP